MKTNFFRNAFIACVSLAMFANVFMSCQKDDNADNADKTVLTALIAQCQTLLDAATTAKYPQSAITTFQTTVTTAKTAIESTSITQTAIDNLVVQITAAKAVFLAAAYDAIPASALLMGLSFDEGTGLQLTAAGKSWIAVLTKGPSQIFGTATNIPSFITGKVGKAMYFSNGSHLEISNYTASDLLGSKLSIAVWVKPDSTRLENYIMSYNYWKTWKFQLQEKNKPFFTTHTTAGVTDANNQSDFSAPNNAWTHLAVCMDLTAGKLVFYVNGVSTMEWTSITQPKFTGTLSPYSSTLPLMIGACTTYSEAMATWDVDWAKTPAAWASFVGAMDELKLYKIALTDGQVAKLYNEEK
jgi:Concanavalin A-like lectin/glucanases superfamily